VAAGSGQAAGPVAPPAAPATQAVPGQSGGPHAGGPGPVGVPAGPAGAPATPRRSRSRLVLAVLAGVMAVMVAGLGVVFVLYDRATAPDRSAPDVVVDNYLRAFLVDRNDVKARLFTCDNADLAQVAALRADLQAREARFATTFTVSWGPLAVDTAGDTAQVSVDLIVATVANNLSLTDRQPWRFTVAKTDAWQVCGARRAG
jgi:hypothetical protein